MIIPSSERTGTIEVIVFGRIKTSKETLKELRENLAAMREILDAPRKFIRYYLAEQGIQGTDIPVLGAVIAGIPTEQLWGYVTTTLRTTLREFNRKNRS